MAAKYFGDDQLTVGVLRPQPRRPESQTPHAARRACATEGRHVHDDITDILRAPGRLLLALAAPAPAPRIPIQHWTQPSGAKVYLVESPSHADGRRAASIRCRRPARPGATRRAWPASTAGMTSKGMRSRATASPRWTRTSSARPGPTWAPASVRSAGIDRMSFSLRSLTYPDLLPKAVQLAARADGRAGLPGQPSGSASASASPRPSARPTPARHPGRPRLRRRRSMAAIPMAMT